jgi:hypothetical protein
MEQTELNVVNALLKVIGESPVNEIDLGHPDVVTALLTWEEYSSELQSNSWWYNKETWALVAQTNGTVIISSDVIAIDGPNTNYIKKGSLLYDMEYHTYDFTDATAEDLTLNLITQWDIEELPPVMYNYILSRSKLSMLVDLAFDANKEKKLEKEVEVRRFLAQKHQIRFSGPNARNTYTARDLLRNQPTRWTR